MEIGDETVAEQPTRLNLQLPDSHIQMQEQQESKQNMKLSYHELMSIASSRLQRMQQQVKSINDSVPKSAQDFISNNVDKLRNLVKLSPRFSQD
jgi:hypothetical protein